MFSGHPSVNHPLAALQPTVPDSPLSNHLLTDNALTSISPKGDTFHLKITTYPHPLYATSQRINK